MNITLNHLLIQAAKSIMEFKFNKKRARILTKSSEFPDWGTGVIYWMFRDQRIHGNLFVSWNMKISMNFYFLLIFQTIGRCYMPKNWPLKMRCLFTFVFAASRSFLKPPFGILILFSKVINFSSFFLYFRFGPELSFMWKIQV